MSETGVISPKSTRPSGQAPYPRSWIDRLVQAIDRLPGPAWLFYVVMFVTGALLNNAVRWLDGSLAAGEFIPIRVLDAGYYVFFIALYHHLRWVARRSFKNYLPLLNAPGAEAEVIEYRLTTLPRRFGWLAFALGLALAVAALQTDPATFGLDIVKTIWPFVYLYILSIFTFSSLFALLIQIIRQLWLVNFLHQQVTQVNLFQLTSAHALADLTARTGIGLVLFVVFSGLTESTNISDLNLYGLVIIGVLAVIVFVAPLLGMRNRLDAEKERLLSAADERIQLTISRIHARVDADEQGVIGDLQATLSALIEERKFIQAISTLPWEPGTLRGFASTVVLPILLWLVTRLLERLI